MTTSTPAPRSSTPLRRRLRIAAIAAVALVPLAFAGLFVAALGNPQSGVDKIPAAVVNQDKIVTTTGSDGSKQYVLAGRQLVTQLTGTKSPGMDWTITNAADAKKMLASGQVYAVLTVPSDFSKSVLSLQGTHPEVAKLSIRTDDAHSYLAGSVAQSLGDGMTRAFGSTITQQYVSALASGLGQLGGSLTQASTAAGQLSSGADSLAGGASQLSSGVSQYTAGVSALSSGLTKLDAGAGSLSQLSSGVQSYTVGVSQLSAALSAASAALAQNPDDPDAQQQVQAISAQLAGVAGQGGTLSDQTHAAVSGIQSGIAQSAAGAQKLAAGGGALVSGVDGLASGSSQLAGGTSQLAGGLASGASQVPSADITKAAAVAADPIKLSVTRANPISQVGQAIATFFVPLGLWIGALAVFLVLKPVSRRVLSSTARSGRVIAGTLLRAGAVTAVQAALLVVLLHVAVGVGWQYLPATLVFSLLVAAAFTAFHYLLTIGLGRAGLVISLFLLAVQVAAGGGLFPVQLLAAPFQWISPYLPLNWATTGMQQIVAGGSASLAIGSAVALLAFGLASVAVAALAIRRTRRAGALGLLPATA